MSNTFDKKATLAQVLVYAKERWCWDDESFINEMFEKSYDVKVDTPKAFVDDLAKDYDLTDPRDVGFGSGYGM